jgi:TrmH family RNA methyltransferase
MHPHRPSAGIDHPRVKQFRAIKRAGGAFALEGLWAIRHAVDAGLVVEVAFVCPALLRGHDSDRVLAGVTTFEVSERVLRRMVDRDGPDGLAAIAHPRPGVLPDVTPSTRLVIADRFELAGNLGTVIRCADGAGCSAVVLTERRVRVTSPLVVKSSMGTVFSMPVVEWTRADAHAWLRANGVRVIAADPAATLSYREAHYDGPLAIVLGSERYGLDPAWREVADLVVSIPMLGVADSLNVGHAAALLLYEALAQQPSTPADARRATRERRIARRPTC